MKRYDELVYKIKDEIIDYAKQIHANPETTNEEVFACKLLSDYLITKGFDVTVDVCGHHTGFIATYDTKIEGPHVAITAEYDALKGLGHACGHNLIAMMSVGSGVVLKDVIPNGKISVYGTPGEEGGFNGSSKASFVDCGKFKDVDFSCSIHPGPYTHATSNFIACRTLEVEFFGTPSHASASPELGCNALDAMINFYNQINALRQQMLDGSRVHGVITHGGDAPNIIVEYTKAVFYVRSPKKTDNNDLVEKFKTIAHASALGSFCKVVVSENNNPVDNVIKNDTFDQLFNEEFTKLGEEVLPIPTSNGSTDVGNVSQVVPTVHPTLKICDLNVNYHTKEFAVATNTDYAYEQMIKGAISIVNVVNRLYNEPETRNKITEEFNQKKEI